MFGIKFMHEILILMCLVSSLIQYCVLNGVYDDNFERVELPCL